jgi:hypothetical protein
MIQFRCPVCDTLLESPEGTVGTKCLCPQCSQQLEVPDPPRASRPRSEGNGRDRARGEKYCHECGAPMRARDEVCPECGEFQLRRRRSSGRRLSRDHEPHRGSLIMVLGILSLVIVPIILGPIAWILGAEDLKKIRQGRMDPEGESMTNTGKVCGMVATIVGLSVLVVVFLVWLFCLGTLFTATSTMPHRRF